MQSRRAPTHLKRRDGVSTSAATRDAVFGCGTRLRGVDLIEQIAANTKLQRQRWIDIYYRLWERKAKVDIAETVVLVDGAPRDWFFTSAVTGEIQRKSDRHLNAIAIKKHFVRESDAAALTRHLAVLVHEDTVGDMAFALLTDLDFNLALCQATSPLWTASFVLQPFLSPAHQHALYGGTFVAKFNASTTSSIRVLHADSYFHDLHRTGVADTPVSSSNVRRRPASAPSTRRKPTTPRGVEELIRTETTKLVAEIEAATHDALRHLHAEFQITRSHRLVLVRVARIVFASDVARARGRNGATSTTAAGRQATSASAAAATSSKRCAGARFCHCKAVATGEINKTSTALSTVNELQQITRKSLQLCDEESAFLDAFGAHGEAHLESLVPQRARVPDAYETFQRVLQRRLFMLRSTLWNPESDSFHAKPLAWDDERAKQPQQYEMVRVCRPCYLIYHAMDAERFQATKSTVKAAARRLTMLHNAKLLVGKHSSGGSGDGSHNGGMNDGRDTTQRPRRAQLRAWEQDVDDDAETPSD